MIPYNPQTLCVACNTKHPIRNWGKHCKTKKHILKYHQACKKGYYFDKIIFDSKYGTRYDLLLTFLPRIKNVGITSNWKLLKEIKNIKHALKRYNP